VSTNEQTANHSSINNQFFYAIADSIEYPKKLTVEQVRNSINFKNISEEEAQQIIESLYKLSVITYKIHKENEFRTI
jgi:hypothetical protein